MLLLFDIAFLLIKNLKNHRLYPKRSKFLLELQAQLATYEDRGEFPPHYRKSLLQKLSKTQNLVLLQKELQTHHNLEPIFRPYLFHQLETYQKKTEYEQAFYTYVISTFDYSSQKVEQEFSRTFISFLDSKSLYTFINTMNAIYRFGESNLLLLAISKMEERAGFYHKKLFVDGLLTYAGDVQELNVQLLGKFHTFSPTTQECLIDYFALSKVNVKNLCLQLLRTPTTHEEVKYVSMRYCSKFPCEESRALFVDILQNPNATWVEQMLAIQGLKTFRDETVRSAVSDKLTDRNFYVRSKAISYLYQQQIGKAEIADILRLRDRYANEALLYQYKSDGEMTAYIQNTIEALENEENKKALAPELVLT